MHRFLLIFLCLLLVACHKEHLVRPTYTYTPTPIPPSSSFELFTFGSAPCHVFLSNILSSGPDSTMAPKFSAAAFFYDTLSSGYEQTHAVKVNSVDLNGTQLVFSDYYYRDTTVASTNPMLWQVQGNGPIPSLTLANSNVFPSCADFYFFPDTLPRNIALIKYFTSLQNVDTGFVLLSDGNKGVGAMFGKTHNKIFFSIPVLQSLPGGRELELYIFCSKNNLVWNGSTRVCLSRNHSYRKKVFLLP